MVIDLESSSSSPRGPLMSTAEPPDPEETLESSPDDLLATSSMISTFKAPLWTIAPSASPPPERRGVERAAGDLAAMTPGFEAGTDLTGVVAAGAAGTALTGLDSMTILLR